MKKILDIGEVSKLSGLPPSTLRYYEEKQLIKSIGRSGLRRLFNHRILERLEFIAMGQQAGFELDEVASMFNHAGQLEVDRKLLLLKAQELEKKIKQLGAIKKTIEHVAHCSAPDHLECPKFLKLLRLAGKKQIRERQKPSAKKKKRN